MENKKVITIIVLLTTIILAAIALFTAVKLYQIGQEPVAASPALKPKTKAAQPSGQVPFVAQEQPGGVCELAFNVGISPSPSITPSPTPSESPSSTPSESPSPSPSESPEVSPSPTPSASPEYVCWSPCDSDSNCPSSLVCQNISGVYRCVNSSCPTESDCVCGAAPTPSPTPTPSQTPLPGCWDTCSSDNDCTGGLVCQSVSGVNRCVNSSCPTDSDCVCGASAAPQVVEASTVPTQKLPEAGFVSPTVAFSLGGLVLLLLGLLF
jgi:hypothetical protein